MPVTPEGIWYPPISEKQLEIYNSYSRYLLVHGPRMSSKTIGVMHKLLRHAWETPYAVIGMFAKFSKTGKIGIWGDLTRNPDGCARIWEREAPGFRITMEPRNDPAGKLLTMRVSNAYGNESEFQLHYINNPDEVESKVKSTRFSMIYFAEMDQFPEECFRVARTQLRMQHLSFEQHQLIGDTNPPETGEDNWMWRLWLDPSRDRDTRKNYDDILVMISDNPYLSEEQIADLKENFSYDPDVYARYFEGKWVASSKDSHFSGIFKKNFHVIGDCSSPDESDWEVILPSKNCQTLLTGWDPGDTNHSAHIIEKVEAENGEFYYAVLDERVVIDENMSLVQFTEEFMEKVERIIDIAGNQNPDWTHWSDNSALIRYRSTGDTYDHLEILHGSNGFVNLQPAPKGDKSQERRIRLVKRLLKEKRLYISANCKELIKSLMYLKRGKARNQYIWPLRYKHAFDSFSYAVYADAIYSMDSIEIPESGRYRDDETSYIGVDLI